MSKSYPVYRPYLGTRERENLIECIDSTWISSKGAFVDQFESALAKTCGTRYAISVSNGTVALHLALLAFDIGPDDEVIVPDFSYVATANAVLYCGATPVLVDVDTRSWNVDISLLENKITSKTKAIIFTDIYGLPADIDSIRALADKYGLKLIEDAAESLGASYKGKPAGGLGDIGTLSFFGNKTITTGEGGAVLTNNSEIADKISKLKNQGNSESVRYFHDVLGYNYRMTNMQAAIGCGQISKLSEILEKKKLIADWYKNNLNGLVTFQKEHELVASSHWMVSFLVENKEQREQLMESLALNNIETRPFFCPIDKLPYFKAGNFPITQDISERGMNVPSYPGLNESDVNFICSRITKFLNQ